MKCSVTHLPSAPSLQHQRHCLPEGETAACPTQRFRAQYRELGQLFKIVIIGMFRQRILSPSRSSTKRDQSTSPWMFIHPKLGVYLLLTHQLSCLETLTTSHFLQQTALDAACACAKLLLMCLTRVK